MSTEAQKRASKKYAAGNTKQIALVLNVKTDADIIKYLQNQENKQGHIKELIREAMREGKKEETMQVLIIYKNGNRITQKVKNAEIANGCFRYVIDKQVHDVIPEVVKIPLENVESIRMGADVDD